MRIKTLLVLAFILIFCDLNAQIDFKPGYVILNNNDTIFGKIDSRGDMIMSKTCRFISNNSDSILTLNPKDIVEYRFVDKKCYVSRTLESGTSVFLEYLIKGKLNVYYYRDDEGKDYYLIDKENLPLKVVPYKEEIRFNDDGAKVLYQSKYHIGLLKLYTSDADEFKQEPIKINKPDHNNLIKFAEDYHNTVCKDEKCIIYEKEVPLIKASIEIIYGFTNCDNIFLDYDRSIDFGPNIYFWMPRANEKLHFKTGIIYGQIKQDDIKYILKIPTQIYYLYSHFRIRPCFAFGFQHNFMYKEQFEYYHSIAASLGLNYKIFDNISLTGKINTDFIPIAYTFNDNSSFGLISYSFNLGIRFEL